MKILIACECSGTLRDRFIQAGHDAWSCDTQVGEGHNTHRHIQEDIRKVLSPLSGYQLTYTRRIWPNYWDMLIAHPECKYLCNSGVQWLYDTKTGKRNKERWAALNDAADFFLFLYNQPIYKICVENSVMHGYAKQLIGDIQQTQTVQPYHFGSKRMKATCLWLKNLPPLIKTTPTWHPPKDPKERKKWAVVHNMAPGPERSKLRAVTDPGIADAIVEQWG